MNRSHPNGFTLIEVLVSVFIFAVALLGLAALQIAARKAAFESAQRSLAAAIGQDVLERMRLNTEALSGYTGTLNANTTFSDSLDCAGPANLAVCDRRDFQRSLLGTAETTGTGTNVSKTGGLANPTLCVTSSNAGGSGQYTVTIVWRGREPALPEAGSENASDTCGNGQYGTNNEYRRIFRISTYICREGVSGGCI
ncbi:putative type IV fimbrial biogenesis protein PilV [Methylococcus capsulatus str. Bath]|jgi:type IV pilus assembly protein PilV|uniref:Putative type IV fimbrial biogenesis protein PilV n=1 Tax=Methylococcus capsulatus (strain ATCC 33009 / NCIMB 11132 / Bath) TaxID=243233 RepID=Q60CL6_METCA|nr:type IV pilus modification protein PilV [Methylococcus capsulatus]AAU90737.1 putative type IV fimbrial biogenesis protein PilV [Methylococcus capsulatus str. Bath]